MSTSKAREALQEKRKHGKIVKRDPIQIWELDKMSLRKSINAYCFMCSNKQTEEIKHCTVTKCPLYPVRPYQTMEND